MNRPFARASSSPMASIAALALAMVVRAAPPPQDAVAADGRAAVVAALAEQGVTLDLAAGIVAIDADVLVRDQLLEYLLIGHGGAAHESLFATAVSAIPLHTAMLMLGFEPGNNARWIPNPRRAAPGARGPTFDVYPPEHAPGAPGVYMYVGWRSGEEVYFYRVEDLVADLESGRSMRRHAWVYLGSREIPAQPGRPAGFAAELEGNFVNICFFSSGFTLVTAALPESVDETRWTANPWLVPPSGARVRVVFSRRPIVTPSEALLASLPDVEPAAVEEAGGGD